MNMLADQGHRNRGCPPGAAREVGFGVAFAMRGTLDKLRGSVRQRVSRVTANSVFMSNLSKSWARREFLMNGHCQYRHEKREPLPPLNVKFCSSSLTVPTVWTCFFFREVGHRGLRLVHVLLSVLDCGSASTPQPLRNKLRRCSVVFL